MRFGTFSCLALTCLALFHPRLLDAQIYNVRLYGAIPEGKVLATGAVQKAIDVCHAQGGGEVFFPAGKYLLSSVRLKDNVFLRLGPGSEILASRKVEDYAPFKLSQKSDQSSLVLILAHEAKNVGILGSGIIDGRAERVLAEPKSFDPLIEAQAANAKNADLPMTRWFTSFPKVQLVSFTDCRSVLVEGVTLRRSPLCALEFQWCNEVFVRGVTIRSDLERGVDSTGIELDGSSNAVVTGSIIETGADAICLKTNKTEDRAEPCEDVAIGNCILSTSSCAVKLGADSYADFRRVSVTGCVIKNSNRGLGIIVRDGASVRDVLFSDVVFEGRRRDYYWLGNGEPIYVVVLKRRPESPVGSIRGVTIRNLRGSCQGTSLIAGYPNSRTISDVTLSDVSLSMEPEDRPDKRAREALLVRNVSGLAVDGLQVSWRAGRIEKDWRHALRLSGVTDFEVSRFRGRQGLPSTPFAAIRVENCVGGVVHDCRAMPLTGTFLKFVGAGCREIDVRDNDLTVAKDSYSFSNGADGDTIRIKK